MGSDEHVSERKGQQAMSRRQRPEARRQRQPQLTVYVFFIVCFQVIEMTWHKARGCFVVLNGSTDITYFSYSHIAT